MSDLLEEIAARFTPQMLHDILNTICLDPTTEAKLKQVLANLPE